MRFLSLEPLSRERKVKVRESLELLFLEGASDDDWLVLAVDVVPLESVWDRASEAESDRRMARRKRSLIAISNVFRMYVCLDLAVGVRAVVGLGCMSVFGGSVGVQARQQ